MVEIDVIRKEISKLSEEEKLSFNQYNGKLNELDLKAAKVRYIGFKADYQLRENNFRREYISYFKINSCISIILATLLYFFVTNEINLGFTLFLIFPFLIQVPILNAKYSLGYKPSVSSAIFAIEANKSVNSKFYYRDLEIAKKL